MPLISALKTISTVLAVLLSVCYAYQIVYLFLPFVCKRKPHKECKLYRYGVLIAARNEEAVLPHLLRSIRSQDYPKELVRTFVVADNCTDNTATVAESLGATVYCRFNTRQVGKGYALSWLLEQLEESGQLSQLDAFLVFDADNLLEPDYISCINRTCSDGYSAFCGYRNSKNFGSNWVSAGHSMWYLHDSVHLSQSRHLAGLPCAVTGTGFGFTRQLLEMLGGWNFFTLTEDIEFSVWCATHGISVGYCHDAILYDEQPETFRQSFRQRTRWVQGTIQISFRYLKDLLHGMKAGGKTGYASLEATTLTLWGYLLCGLCGVLSFLTVWLHTGLLPAIGTLLVALAGSFVSMLLPAVLVLLTEHKRILAHKHQLVLGLFAFPIYVLSFFPIFINALFSKYEWPPIEHKVAISAEDLQNIK